jgi:hypothetical protein
MTDSYGELPEELQSVLEETFRAGPPLTELQQIGRGPTIDGLAKRLLRGEVKKLYEPRRVGKTTVARGALRRLRAAGGVDAEVNVAIHRDPQDVARELASGLAAGMSVPEAARSGLQRLMGAVLPAREQLGHDAGAILDVLQGLLRDGHSPARVLANASQHARRPLAVFLDEAHVIASWPAGEQEALGAALRDITGLGVVIASSERRALELLSAEGRPLQYVGDRFSLPPIADADWRSELAVRFGRLGIPIEPGALDILMESSTGQPYCTMLLARESAVVAIVGVGPGGLCTETHVRAALLVARRDEAWQDLI